LRLPRGHGAPRPVVDAEVGPRMDLASLARAPPPGRALRAHQPALSFRGAAPADRPLAGRQLADQRSIADFFLVPESQDIHGVVGRRMAIQGHITGITERDSVPSLSLRPL